MQPFMKVWKIVIFECAALAGIALSAFTVPGNFPLKTFLLISASVFIAANILFFRAVTNKDRPPGKYKMSSRASLALSFIALYWIFRLLRHLFLALQ